MYAWVSLPKKQRLGYVGSGEGYVRIEGETQTGRL